MQSPELSLTGKLDTGLVHGLCLLLAGLKNLGFWLLGLLVLAELPFDFFEYDAGLWDLSWDEVSVTALMSLLLARHLHYCRHFGVGFWAGLARLLLALGRMASFILILAGGVLIATLQMGDASEWLPISAHDDLVGTLFYYGMVLFAIYLAAPASPARPVSVNEATATRIEPTLNTAVKDVSL
ncbi:hypothetical protein SAMN05216296_0014 [Pseudomonas pohangensis]|uniref:Uncharacterized protein n=1 Tax=Pseudomonas pohangensis TaxID=364197 RepID=A0A1H2DUI7_9PSED|nr:hypothetical protein [Pseudomonas pohangensis]SDT86527.1 hypothetical protein SAMN05216296_0014 [Pseudomonas pohangensis]